LKYGVSAGTALAVLCAACAGSDIPAELDLDLANEIAAAYGGGTATTRGGSAGAAGAAAGATGGSGGAAAGGAPASSAASAGAGGAAAGGLRETLNDAGAGGSAATSAGGSSSPTAPASTCDGFPILAANCGTSGCHGEGSNLGTFAASLSAARGYIGKSGTVTCAGQGALINPANPAASILVQKLQDSPPCGNHMPLAGALLSDAEVDCITEWIGSL
jgi:hypothetical protein